MNGPAVLLPNQRAKLGGGAQEKEHAMSQTLNTSIAVVGIDIGKNSFHVVGLDRRGAIVLRQKLVARPGRSTAGQDAALPDRHGGLVRITSVASLKRLGTMRD